MSVYDHVFAACYERWTAASERGGLAERRRELLRGLSGRVLEIGPGPGINLRHYPAAVGEIVLAEPEGPMADRLERELTRSGRKGRVVRSPAESLPLEDGSFDHVVSTFVLCTVTDPDRVLAEIDRVLRPGGSLVFMEHVRAGDPRLARWQDRLHPLWLRFGNGCHCNRPTPRTIEGSALEVESMRRDRMPAAVALVRPMVIGRALAPADAQP